MTSIAAPETVDIRGFALGQFAPLADVFARTLAVHGGAAALSICYQGELVVDLAGGGYQDNALQILFSVSKAVSAVVAAMLHERGILDLDAPIYDVWPEFDRADTRAITTRMVLSHRAGLPAVDRELTLEEMLAGAEEHELERQRPFWDPGTAHGYHAFTFGTLLNGTVRRATGQTIAEYVEALLRKPLGLDLWLSLPETQKFRVHPVQYSTPKLTTLRRDWTAASPIPPGSSARAAIRTDLFNDPRVYKAGWAGTSGVGDARSLAGLFSAVLEPGRVLSAESLAGMTRIQAGGQDCVLGIPINYGSGVQLPFPQLPLLTSRSFGHEAAGGSAVVADDDLGIAVGFTTDSYPPMMGASSSFLALLPTILFCARNPG